MPVHFNTGIKLKCQCICLGLDNSKPAMIMIVPGFTILVCMLLIVFA